MVPALVERLLRSRVRWLDRVIDLSSFERSDLGRVIGVGARRTLDFRLFLLDDRQDPEFDQ